MSKVVIAKGEDIISRTKIALEALSPTLPKKGSKILIKPNLVEPLPRNSGAITRPEVIEGILQFLGNGFEIVVGEGAAIQETEKCFEKAEYYNVLSKYNVKIVNLNKGPFVEVNLGGNVWEKIEIAKVANESYIISVPVLKEHPYKVTLGIKNMMGILRPEASYPNKTYIHTQFGEKICDLVSKIKPRLTVIDATSGMFGSHLHGELRMFNMTIASEDILAADIVGADVLGFSPKQVPYLDLALKRKIGKSPSQIEEL